MTLCTEFHMILRGSICLLLTASLFTTQELSAQGPRGPVTKPDPEQTFGEYRDTSLLVVKFREGRSVRLRDGRWVGNTNLDSANATVQQAKSTRRLFQRSEAQLDEERRALLATIPADIEPPADRNNYYHVKAESPEKGLALLRALNKLAIVETCFPEHNTSVPCEPGDILPITPDFSSRQGYRGPAPTGVDHRASRVIPGGRGEALQVIDIESSWRMNHEDIPQLVPANVIGQHNQALNPNHGVAVIGEIASEWDQFGMTGLADLCAVKVHSHMRQFWASSVNVAAANTPVGGFIVLEVQLSFQGKTSPMESRQDVFDAVRNATLAGKHVIAAAGNGSNNLDSAIYGGIFNRNIRDSGAVIVGATEGSQLIKAGFSNYGSRIDANGWGRNVATTGYGVLFNPGGDVRQQYTTSFSGTSSATPIVTGSAMALAGASSEQNDITLSPAQLRTLLQQNGTDVPGGQIGKRPDLVKLLAAIGLPKGLDISTDASIGGTVKLELSDSPNTQYVVAAAWDRGDVSLGALGRLLLDPATAFIAYSGQLPASGSTLINIPVPNIASLRGATVFMQALYSDTTGLRLSNSVYNYLH